MASKDLKVDELRADLTKRGLSTAGIKPTLVRRLEAAIREESEKMEDSRGRKRPRDSNDNDADSEVPRKNMAIDEFRKLTVKSLREKALERGISTSGTKQELVERLCADQDDVVPSGNDQVEKSKKNVDSNAPKKVKALDELQKMTIKQLRDEAITRGISPSGTKKELLDRLCTNNDNVSRDNGPVETKEEKIVTAVKKGSAVLDKCLPDHIKAQYHVLQVGDDIYDAMLNQTNIGENNNKFFVIQALESDDGGKFMVYYRWGRVGVRGQDKLTGPYILKDFAIAEFEKKFSDKTKNLWFNRKNFVSHPRSYTWLEMDYSETDTEPPVQQKQEHAVIPKPKESKLEARIAMFISLICNKSMMRQQMTEIGYNAEKLPLGKLSKSTILKGYDVLKRISDVIGQADSKTLEQLSGEFYTVIPHDFGFQKTRLFIIDTPQKLKAKLQMVEALAEIEVAMKLIEDDTDAEDPLYSHYRRLHCELMPLDAHSEEYSMIHKYTKNTHAKTHSNYGVDIIQIFKVSRNGEAERFQKFSGTKNRMLLWHGSRLTNWTGILSQVCALLLQKHL